MCSIENINLLLKVHYKGTGIRFCFYISQLENTQMFDKCVKERILFCFDISSSKYELVTLA